MARLNWGMIGGGEGSQIGPVHRICAALDNPQDAYTTVHVAGTNGKGSVVAMVHTALRAAGIPLRESLHQGIHPAWDAAAQRPELFLHEEWVIAVAGDATSTTLLRTREHGPHYELRKRIIVEGAPPVEIYQRRRPDSQ